MSALVDRLESYLADIQDLKRQIVGKGILIEEARTKLSHAGVRNQCVWSEDTPPGQFSCRDCGVGTCGCDDGADDPAQCCSCWDKAVNPEYYSEPKP